MTTTKKVAYGLLTIGTILVAVSVLNIPVINIVGIILGGVCGFIGYKLVIQ